MVFLIEFFEKIDFEKKNEKFPRGQRVSESAIEGAVRYWFGLEKCYKSLVRHIFSLQHVLNWIIYSVDQFFYRFLVVETI